MILYHGSSVGNLIELNPFLSEHQKPYVYFSSNPVIALLHTVKPVPKPFSYYPYGFNEDKVVYSEYYKNCFKDIYKGKTGFLYECENVKNITNPTLIKYVYASESTVKISRCIKIDDVYEAFMKYKENGLFAIKSFEEISEKELNFAYDEIRKNMITHNLKKCIGNPMSQFIITHFSQIWYE